MEYLKEKVGLIANRENGLIEGEHERFKTECIGRSYFTGLVIGPLTFSGVYFLQNKLTSGFKGQNKGLNLITSAFFGIMGFYLTQKQMVIECEKDYNRLKRAEDLKQKNPKVYS